jgi:hypothetical protein
VDASLDLGTTRPRQVRLTRLLALLSAASLLGATLREPSAHACAPAPMRGEEVYTQEERALIVWDEARHVEHFVRTADFVASGGPFGFLVPTPSRPELAEADDAVFERLAELTAPATVHERRLTPFPLGCTMLPFLLRVGGADKSFVSAPAEAGGVEVVGYAHVAGLDAVTLESTDATALATWLEAHGFEFRDALKRWVAPYLARHFSITAFRYVPPAGSAPAVANGPPPVVGPDAGDLALPVVRSPARVGSRAVRLTFHADAPLYPYREPDDARAVELRKLSLFVLGTARVAGSFDDSAKPWPAALPFSAHAAATGALRSALPGVELPSLFWLSEFSDTASKRPAADVVFRPAHDQAEARRPPNVVADEIPLPIPYELPVIGGAWLWWRRRRKARRTREAG